MNTRSWLSVQLVWILATNLPLTLLVDTFTRYFVLRVVDATSGRHAFLGLGFDERGDAFDFSAAMSDHERHVQREQEVKEAVSSGSKVV